jgi:hypothetical protein
MQPSFAPRAIGSSPLHESFFCAKAAKSAKRKRNKGELPLVTLERSGAQRFRRCTKPGAAPSILHLLF